MLKSLKKKLKKDKPPIIESKPQQKPAEFAQLRSLIEDSVNKICEMTASPEKEKIREKYRTLLNSTSDSDLWQIAAEIFNTQMKLQYASRKVSVSNTITKSSNHPVYSKPPTPKAVTGDFANVATEVCAPRLVKS